MFAAFYRLDDLRDNILVKVSNFSQKSSPARLVFANRHGHNPRLSSGKPSVHALTYLVGLGKPLARLACVA